VPEIQVVSVKSRDLLLVKRFDLTSQGGRNAIVSFKTLTGIEDPFGARYTDLAEIVRLYSSEPQMDLEILFRQMIVNILLINTDDHLQNFAMLHTDKGWRLSPSYDIVPNLYQLNQIIQVNQKHSNIGIDDINSEGVLFGIPRKKAEQISCDVSKKLRQNWKKVFEQSKVPKNHTRDLTKNIQHRLAIL
jgi:serine/threonine-protein kinase HipA